MAAVSLVRGTTSKRRRIFIQDNSVVTGAGLTGLLFNSSGLTWYYIRDDQGASVQITLQTMTLGTWATGGFIEVDAVNMPGWYELGIPNAALVSGASVQIHLQGATNMVPVVLDIELTGWDNQNATSGGLTNLDATVTSRTKPADTQARVTLVDTVTSYTGNTPQTGDSYGIVNNGTYGNSALLTAINNINNLSALANLFGPSTLTRPSSGSIAYPFFFTVKNELGQPIDVDGNTVTLTAKNAGGTDRSAGLSSVTHSGTGEYTFTYTVSSSDTDEGLAFTAAGTVLTISRKGYATADVTDADSLTALAAIQAKTDQLVFTVANQVDVNVLTSADLDTKLAEIEGETDDIATVLTNTNTLLSRVGSFTGTGVNTVLGFFNSLFRKDSTLSSDIGGTYDNTTMSLEGMYTKIIHIPEGLPKNTAYDNFKFILRSSTNHITPTAGLTVTAQRCIDDGAWGSCSNSVEDILNGAYSIDLSNTDLNGTSILLYFTAPGADPAFYVIKTV